MTSPWVCTVWLLSSKTITGALWLAEVGLEFSLGGPEFNWPHQQQYLIFIASENIVNTDGKNSFVWFWMAGSRLNFCCLYRPSPLSHHPLVLHPFDGLFSRTTWVSRHQKGKPFWILLEQETMGRQWHQLDHMQIICTSLQTDNHASTSPLRFLPLSYHHHSKISLNKMLHPVISGFRTSF